MENNLEDRQASIEFEDIKGQSNLEYARRIKSEEEKYDQFGQEILPETELAGIYQESSLAEKIERRKAIGLSPVSIFSDIDNTFYRKGEAETTGKLSEILNRNNWGIVYITGRDFPMVDNQEDLPKADVVVGAVGTEIFVRDKEGGYKPDEEFRQLLLNTWDREEVYLKAQTIVERSQGKIKFQGRDVPGAYNPEDPKSEPPQDFKISFNVFGSHEDAKQASDILESEIEGARVILSTDVHNPEMHNIDLLPIHAGKELAVKYLTEKLGVRGLTAGDSGNDLSMLIEGGHPAIIVGGAREEMKLAVVGMEDSPSFESKVKKLPNGQKIVIGRDISSETAAQGLINFLKRGDINPEDAKWLMLSLHKLNKKQ